MGERSVRIGGDAKGNAIATGDRNVVTVTYSASLPPAESVDIRAALAALQQALAGLDPPDKGKMDRALTDAAEEAAKADPDRDEIGGAIERAVKYAKGAADFSKHVGEVKPHLEAACSWLGDHWHRLLPAVGITL